MPILIIAGIVAGALCVLWAVQSVVLKIAGEPLAWPLRFTTQKPLVRYTGRVMVHFTWITILVGTPLALGIDPRDALHKAFPLPVPWRGIGIAFSITFFPAVITYALYLKAGWLRFEPQHDQATRRAKLIRRFLGPLPLAILEEGVFRGVLLEQLLLSFPQSKTDTLLAIVLSSAVFSAAHFVKRRDPSAPVWQPAYGLFIVGCLLGLAYVIGGRSLWLPVVMHATMVFVYLVVKLYAVYQAPPWLVGYVDWPQSGLGGTIFLLCAGIALVLLI
jgi:membrane protease YdiL (CAAX protease family)